MSELLLNWLNKDVGLSTIVTSVEKDFASGYLYGELLSKFQLQPNFHLFSIKDSVREQIGNFALLGPTMKGLNIEYNAKVFDGIMRLERGAAVKLLTQIKMALDQRQNQSLVNTSPLEKARTSVKVSTSLVQIRPSREGYLKMKSLLGQSKVPNRMMMSQKTMDLENRIASFVRFQAVSLEKALAKEEKEREVQIKHRDHRRTSMLNKLRRQRSEKEELRDKSVENWEKSLRVRVDREEKERNFQAKVLLKIRREETEMRNQERKELMRSLDDFEAHIRRCGLSRDIEQNS